VPPEPAPECAEGEDCAESEAGDETDPNADNAAGIEEAAAVPPAPPAPLINPPDWPQDCKAPILNSCPIRDNLNMVKQYYSVDGDAINDVQHGVKRTVVCAEGAAPTSKFYDISTWGEDWYPGPKESVSFCANGTWTNVKQVNEAVAKPQDMNCFTLDQIKGLKKMIHYWELSEKRFNETMNITGPGGAKIEWKDATAGLRKATLEHAHKSSRKLFNDAMEGMMPPASDFDIVVNWMIDNRMDPRGVPMTSKGVCEDLATHWMHGEKDGVLVPTPGVTCSYNQQLSAIGYDYMNRQPVNLFRDGCFCESKWVHGCPWDINAPKGQTYVDFGFASLEQKEVTKVVGATVNHLCWYWTNPTHPEAGYNFGVTAGKYAYSASALDAKL